MDISIIIPAYNEQEHIIETIQSVKTSLSTTCLTYEIIVVDDASTDNTVNLVKKTDVTLIALSKKVFPSEVRNVGAEIAIGKLYVFLDGDILVTPEWGAVLSQRFDLLTNSPVITGSTVSFPNNSNWLIHHWFGPVLNKQRSYINNSHLIASQRVFKKVGGFDSLLETGEDTDFAIRSKEKIDNIQIINDTELKVIHLGYPKTILSFFNRERWHGKGNFASIRKAFTTKIPLMVLSTWIVMFMGIGSSLLSNNSIWMIMSIIYLISISSMFAINRCGINTKSLPSCAFLSCVLITARGMSLVDVLWKKIIKS